MSTYNICFCGEKRKSIFDEKKVPYLIYRCGYIISYQRLPELYWPLEFVVLPKMRCDWLLSIDTVR